LKENIMDLTGKIAVVTGSTKGLGKQMAIDLAKAGAHVVIVSRSQEDCNVVADEIKKDYEVDTLAAAADLTIQSDIDNLVDKTLERFSRVDILVNNAGSSITKKAEELTETDWDRIIDLDLKSVFFSAQAFGKIMIKQNKGKIINISSILGLVGEKQVLPYCVAKGGVLQMTKALGLEWARYNINVNAVSPGYVKTKMNELELETEAIKKNLLGKTPMKRYGTVEEISGAVVFLASEASNYMTGQVIVVDGGWTAQ
jgi:NAD(P)-dependent dehydrogenase (short-subunit alcohol dehydrogenase family)